MADGGGHSRYVKLTKDQAPLQEDITPGELNQPIEVPQLNVQKCNECGQPLPETFQPPADEPWTTGISAALKIETVVSSIGDFISCVTGLFCPCVQFGRNVESVRDDEVPWTHPCICHAIFVEGGLGVAAATAIFYGVDPNTSFLICEGLVFAWWMCGVYTGLVRQSLQKKYHLKNSPCDPCMVHCCLHWCALCQEHREMKGRLSESSVMPMTVVNPPPVQQMNKPADDNNNNNNNNNQDSTSNNGHITMEMQPL